MHQVPLPKTRTDSSSPAIPDVGTVAPADSGLAGTHSAVNCGTTPTERKPACPGPAEGLSPKCMSLPFEVVTAALITNVTRDPQDHPECLVHHKPDASSSFRVVQWIAAFPQNRFRARSGMHGWALI